MEVDIDRLRVDSEIPNKKKEGSSESELIVEFSPKDDMVGTGREAIFTYRDRVISKTTEIMSRFVRIRFLDKERNRVLLDKQVERGKEYSINIMDNEIDNPGNYLKLNENGMAIGFKINDGEWGPDMDHKETFRRVIWEDTEVECEMLRFDVYYEYPYSWRIVSDISNKILKDLVIGVGDGESVSSRLPVDVFDDNRISPKYLCCRPSTLTDTFQILNISPSNFSSYQYLISKVQRTFFKYSRNIVNFEKFLLTYTTDLILEDGLFKYFKKLKSIGKEFRSTLDPLEELENEGSMGFVTIHTTRPYSSNFESNTKSFQQFFDYYLEFLTKELPPTVEYIDGLIDYRGPLSNSTVYNYGEINFKYNGSKVLKPLTNIKIIRELTHDGKIANIDPEFLKLFPNIEILSLGTWFKNSKYPLPVNYLSNFKNLKYIYSPFGNTNEGEFQTIFDGKLNDSVFSENNNLIGMRKVFSYLDPSRLDITEEIFKNNPNLTRLNYSFARFSDQNILDILFKSANKYLQLTNLDYLFNSSYIETFNEEWLFKHRATITNVKGMFSYCGRLTHIPELWDKSKYPNIIEHAEFAKECTVADNYDQVPEGWK